MNAKENCLKALSDLVVTIVLFALVLLVVTTIGCTSVQPEVQIKEVLVPVHICKEPPLLNALEPRPARPVAVSADASDAAKVSFWQAVGRWTKATDAYVDYLIAQIKAREIIIDGYRKP